MRTYNEMIERINETSQNCEGWRQVQHPRDVLQNHIYASADGVLIICGEHTDEDMFWGKVEQPIHNQVKKGDIFAYKYDELWIGNSSKWKNWDLDGLRDDILDGAKHKSVDNIKLNTTVEEYEIYEKALDDKEISSLIRKARDGVVAIRTDIKRDKKEKDEAKEILKWIEGVRRTWKNKKSLHPNTVLALMKTISGTQSANPSGFGYRTIGWKQSPDGKVPDDFSNPVNEELMSEGKRGMTDAMIKAGALMAKRFVVRKTKEGDIPASLRGIASLILFSIASNDRGSSIMSKALATSALFKEEYEKE